MFGFSGFSRLYSLTDPSKKPGLYGGGLRIFPLDFLFNLSFAWKILLWSWWFFLVYLNQILFLEFLGKNLQVRTYLDVFLPRILPRSYHDFSNFIMLLIKMFQVSFHWVFSAYQDIIAMTNQNPSTQRWLTVVLGSPGPIQICEQKQIRMACSSGVIYQCLFRICGSSLSGKPPEQAPSFVPTTNYYSPTFYVPIFFSNFTNERSENRWQKHPLFDFQAFRSFNLILIWVLIG